MKKVYAFDVDGTLTPSRLTIDRDFRELFLDFQKRNDVYLVTGSDKDKTIEQVTYEVWLRSKGCLQSCGNHIFERGREVYRNNWKPGNDLLISLNQFLKDSPYPIKTSNHIEERIGLVNFSVVGRDCTQEERDAYGLWDDEHKERLEIADKINKAYPTLEASVGGQISIDIHPKGANKSQAKQWILSKYREPVEIHFFGDKTLPGGNDYDLAKILNKPHKVYQVEDWTQTENILTWS